MAYRGLIAPIPIGQGGLTGTKNMSQVSPEQLIISKGISLSAGNLQKEGGAAKYNAAAVTGAPTILSGFDWWPNSSTQRMVIFASDGKLYKDAGLGTFSVTLKSGLSIPTKSPVMVEGGAEVVGNNKKLFFFNGINNVQVLAADGVATADLTTPPADWGTVKPVSGCIHEGRLWGFAGHYAYFSAPTDHEDFTTAGTTGQLAVYPGVGDEILAGISYKGFLIVFKYPVGIYAIDTSNSDVTKWRVIKLNHGIGICSPLGLCQIEDDVLFMDPQASINLLSGVQEFGSIKSASISSLVYLNNFTKANLNYGQLKLVQVIYYVDKKEVHTAACATGVSVNNRRVTIDFNKQVPRFGYSERDTCPSIWLRKDTDGILRPVIGDNLGFVYLLDQASRLKGTAGYLSEFQSGYYDLSHVDPTIATKRKNAQFLEIVVEPTGDWNLSVDVYWDGDYKETVLFTMGPAGAVLGTFLLGTDKLGGGQLKNRRHQLHGGGKRISIAGGNSGPSEDFSLAMFYLEFEIADERESA